MVETFTYATSDCLAVEAFYSERLAERWEHSVARELAFDTVRVRGAWHVRRNVRAALRSVLSNHRTVRITSVEFEDFDSGRMPACGHFAVTLEGPYEKLAEFAVEWDGCTAEEFADGIERKWGA